jgi:hypothetical protein
VALKKCRVSLISQANIRPVTPAPSDSQRLRENVRWSASIWPTVTLTRSDSQIEQPSPDVSLGLKNTAAWKNNRTNLPSEDEKKAITPEILAREELDHYKTLLAIGRWTMR